jgi:hypothetical protein
VVGEDLAAAEENGSLVAVDVAAAAVPKRMNRAF